MEFFYNAVIPIVGASLSTAGVVFQAEIKDYFKSFNFRKNWYDLAMFIITICIIIMTITIVEYKP